MPIRQIGVRILLLLLLLSLGLAYKPSSYLLLRRLTNKGNLSYSRGPAGLPTIAYSLYPLYSIAIPGSKEGLPSNQYSKVRRRYQPTSL